MTFDALPDMPGINQINRRAYVRSMTNLQSHKRLPISAFIICKNEADRIGVAIASVIDWVDEVVVVDSGSSDETVSKAEALGARVMHHDWPGYGLQKRYAEDQCCNDWLLNIDADEQITPALRDEIASIFAKGPEANIYKMEILDIYPHEDEAKSFAYGYWQYRLYDRNYGRFSDSPVHDTVRPLPHATLAKLKAKVNHRSVRSIQFSVEKMNRYSDMQRDDMVERGRKISRLRLWSEFPVAFFKSYILRQQCRYGIWGLVIAHNYAYSRFLRIAKMVEHQLLEEKGKL